MSSGTLKASLTIDRGRAIVKDILHRKHLRESNLRIITTAAPQGRRGHVDGDSVARL
jgi:hypothetical protein